MVEWWESIQNHFMRPSITLVPKQDKHNTRTKKASLFHTGVGKSGFLLMAICIRNVSPLAQLSSGTTLLQYHAPHPRCCILYPHDLLIPQLKACTSHSPLPSLPIIPLRSTPGSGSLFFCFIMGLFLLFLLLVLTIYDNVERPRKVLW